MTPEQEQAAHQLIQSYVSIYGSYRQNKEQMAYAAAVLYLAGSAWVLSSETAFWKKYELWPFVALSLLFEVTAVGAFLFVGWQFRQRSWASDMVEACMIVITRWLDRGIAQDDLKPAAAGRVSVPKAVADELAVRIDARRCWWMPRDLTFVLMAAWTLAAAVRVVDRWEGFR